MHQFAIYAQTSPSCSLGSARKDPNVSDKHKGWLMTALIAFIVIALIRTIENKRFSIPVLRP